jgi:hypothetical protein
MERQCVNSFKTFSRAFAASFASRLATFVFGSIGDRKMKSKNIDPQVEEFCRIVAVVLVETARGEMLNDEPARNRDSSERRKPE